MRFMTLVKASKESEAPRFGMHSDRFGVGWMVSVADQQS
jgi:uncharacterized glyoxalase superfamily protein PhnB